MLIIILNILFVYLIIQQIYISFNTRLIEGLTTVTDTYQPYNTSNPNNVMILAQQNAGNINVLKGEIDQLLTLNQEVKDISGNVVILNQQVQALIQQQATAAQQIAGNTPLNITSSSSSNTST